MLKNKLNPSKLSIMDINSGHGEISLGLAYYFKKVIGIESSVLLLEQADFNED